jgi:transposase
MSTDAASSPRAALQVDPGTLPDDAALLKSLVAQLFAELQSRDGRISDLEHRMSLLLRKLYGSKSEKLDPRQASLFDLPATASEVPQTAAPDASPTADTSAATRSPKSGTGHGRRRLPDQLQRREVEHDLTASEKEALGGADNLVVIGREVTEQLEWEPSCLYVIRHVQLTYARRQLLPESGLTLAEQNVLTASKPPQPIDGGLPGPGLLAQVLASKYADHIPLYRFERISGRHGVELSRKTTCGWAMQCADLFRPLYELMIQRVLASYVVHADDTTVKIRDAQRKLKYTGYFHTYVGDVDHPLIVFDYTTSHGRDGPKNFLGNFQGYLQVDAASIYDGLFNQPGQLILEVGCWMHGRRNFFEARATDRPAPSWCWLGLGSCTLSRRISRGAARTNGATCHVRSGKTELSRCVRNARCPYSRRCTTGWMRSHRSLRPRRQCEGRSTICAITGRHWCAIPLTASSPSTMVLRSARCVA